MFRNPLMIGIGLGFVGNITQVVLPSPLTAVIEMLAAVTLPVALFAIGGVLTRYSLGSSLGAATSISLLSLLVHPALVWLLGAHVFSVDFAVLRNAVLMAAMAPGINAFVFATMYKRKTDIAASVVLLGTMASVLTASTWIWFLC